MSERSEMQSHICRSNHGYEDQGRLTSVFSYCVTIGTAESLFARTYLGRSLLGRDSIRVEVGMRMSKLLLRGWEGSRSRSQDFGAERRRLSCKGGAEPMQL